MTDTDPPPAPDKAQHLARRTRALIGICQARLANSLLRFAACAVVAVVAMAILGDLWAIWWLMGMAAVLLIDRRIYQRLLQRLEAGEPPPPLRAHVAWTAAQCAYANIIAAMLWFAPYVPGETLAIIYLLGGVANSAATLRPSHALSSAGAGTSVAFLLGLPLSEYLMSGGRDALALTPLLGGLLMICFGLNLWRSLLASDEAQARAEAAAIRERQAAAAAAAAKSDMIRRINDELRTPMAAVIGAAEHLRRSAMTPQAQAHIATLLHAGEVMRLALSDVSDLDRLENGRLPIEPGPADPREIARQVVAAFRTAAVDKNLELFLDAAANTPALVEIDAARVRQVLFNLIANAVRYTTHGGVRVRLSVQQAGDPRRVRLCFAIADTGSGMSRAQLATALNRERLLAGAESAGLGLAISQRLARLMGGELQARSELGEGSVFSFVLDAPVLAQRAPATRPAAA